MMKSVRRLSLVAFAILSVLSAQAVEKKDWYVSDDMQYGRGIVPDANCTNDLQAAIDGCSENYTVWVANGFVCSEGTSYGSEQNRGRCRIRIPKNVTVRSEAGYVDEANGKGAKIIGAPDPDTGGNGPKAIRCVTGRSYANVKLIGFILENGHTPVNNSYGLGGGFLGVASGIVSNCLIRNCRATRGGGVAIAQIYNCVITNCTGGIGSGTYNSTMISRTVVANCGGSSGGIGWDANSFICVTNCFVHSNAGGGFNPQTTMNDVNIYSTVISNNISRGVRGYNDSRQSRPRLFNCTIVDNVATNGESGAGAYHCELHDCTVVGNRIQGKAGNGAGCSECRIYGGMVASNVVNGVSSKDSLGGGVYDCTVYDCKIVGNLLGYGCGGGCSSSTLEDCQICDNTITNGGFKGAGCYYCTLTNCTVSGNRVTASTTTGGGYGAGVCGRAAVNCRIFNNVGGFRGGGANEAVLVNCIVSNNVTRSTGGGAGGGGAFNCEAYNSIFADNHATNGVAGVGSYQNEANENCLVNCTIVNNPEGGFAGPKAVFNCIAWGNGTGDSSCTACTNSCVEKLSCSKQSGCFSTDPRLDARYAPKSAKCHNKAYDDFDWMTDPNDVRSKDVYGAARVQGKGPDIGAVEQPDFGLMMRVR